MSIFDDIGNGFKKVGEAILNGDAKVNGAIVNGLRKVLHVEGFSEDELQQLPDGVTPSESWTKLSAALAEAEQHAQVLAADWDNQKHVAAILEKSAEQKA
ncbi:hypothetical protein [Actinopolyspora saharensis]|uniref:Uncharacterized protein n=1 Tax=Actinopolyspora saharensis TaxID=995062 RepID=A0A1H0YQB4_9ACTN|nr:hypothetical protein [Actinopolyspora saharensis]SDQ17258.1 hypothetical protein SAMN04489718_0605 [Actinopolyspora saharensis]